MIEKLIIYIYNIIIYKLRKKSIASDWIDHYSILKCDTLDITS